MCKVLPPPRDVEHVAQQVAVDRKVKEHVEPLVLRVDLHGAGHPWRHGLAGLVGDGFQPHVGRGGGDVLDGLAPRDDVL